MAKVDKRASRSLKARTRARAIYISLTKSANGEPPTDRKIVEHLTLRTRLHRLDDRAMEKG